MSHSVNMDWNVLKEFDFAANLSTEDQIHSRHFGYFWSLLWRNSNLMMLKDEYGQNQTEQMFTLRSHQEHKLFYNSCSTQLSGLKCETDAMKSVFLTARN